MEFKIIELEPEEKRYYPASVDLGILDDGNYVKHTEMQIPLGKSRYGGPIIDLLPGVDHPKDLRFACQLDLAELAKLDQSNLLPQTGQLIIFCNLMTSRGKVIYSNVDNGKLERIIVEHEEDFWDGVLIKIAQTSTENLKDRYRDPEDEWEKENLQHLLNAAGKLWDDFAGSEQSKLLGILSHCQLGEEEIIEKIKADKIVLVQFGENGFNDAGVFSVLIHKNDLKNLDFENCEFYWGQS